MSQIHIRRDHTLGLAKARKVAFAWAEQVETEFDMECTYEEGDVHDLVTFTRSGVKGTLDVSATHFELNAKLGFLVGAFKGHIEAEIVKTLDQLLAAKPASKAVAKPAAKKRTPKAK